MRLQIYLMLYKLVQKVGKYQCYVGRSLLNIAETGYINSTLLSSCDPEVHEVST